MPRIFCGNLPGDVEEREVADLFSKYGRISRITVKNSRDRHGTGFAFIDFDHSEDADCM